MNLKKELQEYLDNVIEHVEHYRWKSFTYATIIIGAFNYTEDLKGYYINYDLKKELEGYIFNYFEEMYLLELDNGALKDMLQYADIKVLLELLDIAELTDVIDELLEVEEDEDETE